MLSDCFSVREITKKNGKKTLKRVKLPSFWVIDLENGTDSVESLLTLSRKTEMIMGIRKFGNLSCGTVENKWPPPPWLSVKLAINNTYCVQHHSVMLNVLCTFFKFQKLTEGWLSLLESRENNNMSRGSGSSGVTELIHRALLLPSHGV